MEPLNYARYEESTALLLMI